MDEKRTKNESENDKSIDKDEFVFNDTEGEVSNLREKEKIKSFFKKHGKTFLMQIIIVALVFGNISGSRYKEIAKESLVDGLDKYVETLEEMNLEYARTINQDNFTYDKQKTQMLVEESIDMLSLLRDCRKVLLLTYDDQDGIEAVREMAARLRNFSADGRYSDYEIEYIKKDYEYSFIMLNIIKETVIKSGVQSGEVDYNFSKKANINKVVTAICKKSAELVHSEEYKIVESYDWNPNESLVINYTRDEAYELSKEIMGKILPEKTFNQGEESDYHSRFYYFNRSNVDIFKPATENLNKNTQYACDFDKETGSINIRRSGWIKSNPNRNLDYEILAFEFLNKLTKENSGNYELVRVNEDMDGRFIDSKTFFFYKVENEILYDDSRIIIEIANSGELANLKMSVINNDEEAGITVPVVTEKEILGKIQISGDVENIKLIYINNSKLIYRIKLTNKEVAINIDYDAITGEQLQINGEKE